eukprot:jgi/Astpho2/7590/fgenesh1_pm.00115_%23_8_t
MADGAGQSEAGQQGLGAASAKSSKKERKALKHKQQEAASPSSQKTAAAVPAANGKSQKRKKAKPAAQPAAEGPGAHAAPEVGKADQDRRPNKKAKLSAAAAAGSAQPAAKAAPLKPKMCFAGELLHAIRDFVEPSPIQAQCWPIISSGHDLVGIAATGSGKTLAFGLPALQHIRAQRTAGVTTGNSPSVLILSPTRELALQTAGVMEEAGSRCGLKTLCVYGGVPKPPQVRALKQGIDVLVATPGRLEDLVQDKACRLAGITYLVLDEADRMLDLGFEPHIRAIAQQTRADRHTLMFSATWPSSIQKLASEFLSHPVKVTIGSQDLSASHSVTQVVEVIDPRQRDSRLDELLHKYHSSRKNRVIIFVLYKKEAARVEALLQKKGWKAVAVHGDASQHQRTRAVEQFKSGEIPLLVATDVAARGLDIPDVEAVINYSFPLTTEDYVHRIGRTGRAGKTGVSHTFFSGATDKARAGELINVLKEAGQVVPKELMAFGTTVKKKESALYGAHFKDVDLTQKSSKITFDD